MKAARASVALLTALAASGCVVAPIPLRTTRVEAVTQPTDVPPGMQYLYGSGEAAAISIQAWRAVTRYAGEQVRARPRDSMVLDEGATLAAPRFVPCGMKPLAAVFDVDETVVLNRGFERDAAAGQPYSEARWRVYELTGGTTALATPGAREALAALRAMGVTVVFNSNRSAGNAPATEAMLARLGLGPATHGETLFLQGDDTTGSAKDGRRARIAARYCVIAMGGDQLGDFSDLFASIPSPGPRRAAASESPISTKWGAGWFVLPNPVYGAGLKGMLDEVFPADTHWAPEP